MAIPREILELYRGSSFLDLLYVRGRWLMNNFEFIESLLPKRGSILDIGCGYGLLSNYVALKSDKRNVMGVDLSGKRIRVAKQSANKSCNVKFKLEDVNNLTSLKFDAMMMTDFLHHICYDEQDRIIGYAYNNLKKNGKLVIKEVNKQPTFIYLFHSGIDKYLWNFGGNVYFFSTNNLVRRLKNAGFKVSVIKEWKRAFSCESLIVCTKVLPNNF